MAAWLGDMVMLHSSREFDCSMKETFSAEDCAYYTSRWHFWYIADRVYALPTIAFFMSTIGLFIIGNFISQVLGYRKVRGPAIWRKLIAAIRWLSYRGYHVKTLRWNSAPVGVLLLGGAGAVFFFCMDLIPQPYYWKSEDFGGSPPLGTRSGWMALACMPFVFATASKANWITLLTGVPHERLQVFHRWISYAFFLLALMHTFPFIVYHIRFHDMVEDVTESSILFYWTGIVALIFQAWLTFASHSTIRMLGYEFFKITHFAAVIAFVLIFFWHCDYTLTSWDYFIATAAIYVPSLVYPWLRTFFEYGGTQEAMLRVEDCGFTRISIPAKFDWSPGQHCFLRFRGFGLNALSSHPFTICSLPSKDPNEPSELVFYIRHQGGFTAKLYQYALEKSGTPIGVLVDGPYGGANLQRFYEAEHLLVIAGGSGAGWILPFIELFVRQSSVSLTPKHDHDKKRDIEKEQSTQKAHHLAGTLSMRVILATRDNSSRIWFERTVGHLLANYPNSRSASDIRIQVCLTGESEKVLEASGKATGEAIVSNVDSSSSIMVAVDNEGHETHIPGKEVHGRPQLPLIVHEEAHKADEIGQSMGVYVCGPETMQDDVRNAVAAENLKIVKGSRSSSVYLHCEHFTWA